MWVIFCFGIETSKDDLLILTIFHKQIIVHLYCGRFRACICFLRKKF